jgi:hypothetical protein
VAVVLLRNLSKVQPMSCPHLKEAVMLFCQACPVKKMLPLDRVASVDPCLGGDFRRCPLFQELADRLTPAQEPVPVFEPVEPRRGVTP